MENNKFNEKAHTLLSAVTNVTVENSSLRRKFNKAMNGLIFTNIFYLSVLEIICLFMFI